MAHRPRTSFGCTIAALLSLGWLAACTPIGCPGGRVPQGEQCVCPDGTREEGILCIDLRAPAPDAGDESGGPGPIGRRGDGGESSAPVRDGGSTPRADGGSVVSAPDENDDDAGQMVEDAGRSDGTPPPPPPDPDRAKGVEVDETPVPPPPPEPSCADRCASKQCDGAGRCLECVSDRDCQPSAPHCAGNNRCVECTSGAHCPGGMRCGDDNACVRTGCGDGRPDPGEECDDGNDDPTDGCFGCVQASCGDGQINGTDQCEAGVGWLTSEHCQPDCTFRHFRLCAGDDACPGGRCFRGVCAPAVCSSPRRQDCQGFSSLVDGNDKYCPGLPENAPRLIDGSCVLRCNAGTCPATLTCVDNSYCAARR